MPTPTNLERPQRITPSAAPAPADASTRDVRVASMRSVHRVAAVLVAGGMIAGAATSGAVIALLKPDRAGTAGLDTGGRPSRHALPIHEPGGISVVRSVYEPGQESGWHAHSGIHAVAIVSGSLTVYDADCRAQSYDPDRPYIGGQEVHLLRNETTQAVEMVVTYVSSGAPARLTRAWAVPPCWENSDG
jgi:quercetin dioxygenase-like cupin family protein